MSRLPVLEPEEQRVLGSLVEKQVTVPATYPLSANALRSACNQTSSRDPVLDLDEPTVLLLVRELERRPGQQDHRWVHLLGPASQHDVPAATPAVDRDLVLADGPEQRDAHVRTSYDAVAAGYADEIAGELADLPFERWLLDRVMDAAGGGPVVDVGSGPGHVTDHLAEHGADATGIDLSPAMVEEARRRFPGPVFEVGDLRRLGRPPTSSGWAAVLAWYSLVLHDPAHVVGVVEAAGLVDVEWFLRGPIASRGETTQRLDVIGRRR